MTKKAKTIANDFEDIKKHHPEPFFHFQNLPPSERLEYERLNWSNYRVILEMFGKDENPFIQEDYKNAGKLEEYAQYAIELGSYSPKHGQCDWLYKVKSSGEYVGLLNLHELSMETFNDNHKKCFIGFVARRDFRRQYYTMEAVRNLIDYAARSLSRNLIIANTDKGNEVSKALLEKMGFCDVTDEYYYGDKYNYYKLDFRI